jgi:hypothetical protein
MVMRSLERPPDADRPDPRALGLVKAAYIVGETLEILSIGRTSLYDLVKRGELRPAKLGKKTLFLANDLAAFLTRLSGATDRSASRIESAGRQIGGARD